MTIGQSCETPSPSPGRTPEVLLLSYLQQSDAELGVSVLQIGLHLAVSDCGEASGQLVLYRPPFGTGCHDDRPKVLPMFELMRVKTDTGNQSQTINDIIIFLTSMTSRPDTSDDITPVSACLGLTVSHSLTCL